MQDGCKSRQEAIVFSVNAEKDQRGYLGRLCMTHHLDTRKNRHTKESGNQTNNIESFRSE